MRIGMFIWFYWPGPQGGAERFCRIWAHILKQQGHDCTVITQWLGKGFQRREMDEGTRIIRCGIAAPVHNAIAVINRFVKYKVLRRPPPVPSAELPLWRPLLAAESLHRFFFMVEAACYAWRHRREMDLIHAHESHWISGFSVWLAKKMKIPCVVFDQGVVLVNRPLRASPLMRFWLKQRLDADCVVVLTAARRQEFIEAGFPAEKITIIPNAVEIPARTASPASSKQVLYVGNFSQGAGHKGFDVLIAAWSEVHRQHPDWSLVMAGRGDAEAWKKMAATLDCGPSIVFKGWCADMAGLYETAAIHVLPSRTEGLSMALLEAQSWGLPSVVTDIPGSSAVVTSGRNGYVVPVADAPALANAIMKLIAQPAERDRMGREARRLVTERYALPVIADQWFRVYDQIRTGSKAG